MSLCSCEREKSSKKGQKWQVEKAMERDKKLKRVKSVSTNNAHYNMPVQISLHKMLFQVN